MANRTAIRTRLASSWVGQRGAKAGTRRPVRSPVAATRYASARRSARDCGPWSTRPTSGVAMLRGRLVMTGANVDVARPRRQRRTPGSGARNRSAAAGTPGREKPGSDRWLDLGVGRRQVVVALAPAGPDPNQLPRPVRQVDGRHLLVMGRNDRRDRWTSAHRPLQSRCGTS